MQLISISLDGCHDHRAPMSTDEYQNLVKGYLAGELALEPVATRLAQLEVEEGWYLYYNRLYPETATDVRLVVCVSVGTAVAFVASAVRHSTEYRFIV